MLAIFGIIQSYKKNLNHSSKPVIPAQQESLSVKRRGEGYYLYDFPNYLCALEVAHCGDCSFL